MWRHFKGKKLIYLRLDLFGFFSSQSYSPRSQHPEQQLNTEADDDDLRLLGEGDEDDLALYLPDKT